MSKKKSKHDVRVKIMLAIFNLVGGLGAMIAAIINLIIVLIN